MRHLTLNGKPYCQCGLDDQGLTLHQLEQLMASAHNHGLFLICMHNQPSDEAAVEFLNTQGIPVVLTEGPCPEFGEPDPAYTPLPG